MEHQHNLENVAKKKHPEALSAIHIILIVAVSLIILTNQFQIQGVSAYFNSGSGGKISKPVSKGTSSGSIDLASVDVNQIQSTAQGIAALFPTDKMKSTDEAIALMIPVGTPDYGEAMGVSYDDPVTALDKLSRAYPALDAQIKQNPELWQRYLNLASEPRGVSCEYCCGVGPIGITKDGRSRCGCQHNPALLALTEWLLMNTDYSDAQILQEVYKWKTLFFPKNMIGLATQIAGGDASVLEDLPGMVGGC